jgi:hypothetical protein
MLVSLPNVLLTGARQRVLVQELVRLYRGHVLHFATRPKFDEFRH